MLAGLSQLTSLHLLAVEGLLSGGQWCGCPPSGMVGGQGLCVVWLEQRFLSERTLSWGCSCPGLYETEGFWLGLLVAPRPGKHRDLAYMSVLSPEALGEASSGACSRLFYVLWSGLLVMLSERKRGKVCSLHLPRRKILPYFLLNFIFTFLSFQLELRL